MLEMIKEWTPNFVVQKEKERTGIRGGRNRLFSDAIS